MLGMGCGVQAVTPGRRRDRPPHGLYRDPRFGLAAPCQEPAGIWTTGAGTSSTHSQLDSGEVWGWRRLLNLSSGKRKTLALLCQRVLAAGVCVQLPLRPVCTTMPKGQLLKSLWQLGTPRACSRGGLDPPSSSSHGVGARFSCAGTPHPGSGGPGCSLLLCLLGRLRAEPPAHRSHRPRCRGVRDGAVPCAPREMCQRARSPLAATWLRSLHSCSLSAFRCIPCLCHEYLIPDKQERPCGHLRVPAEPCSGGRPVSPSCGGETLPGLGREPVARPGFEPGGPDPSLGLCP